MEICTIGFTKRSAAGFFGALTQAGVRRLIDVRLNNTSHLAGFTKRDDLPYFLREVCGIEYMHELRLAPTQAMLDEYKKRHGDWSDYAQKFISLLETRDIATTLDRELFAVPSVLLCSEATPERCHRRLVVEYLDQQWGGISARHL